MFSIIKKWFSKKEPVHYGEVLENILQILLTFQVRIKNSNYIGKENYVSWQQLKEMQDNNIEIGSHTANHLPLTEVENLDNEIKLSKLLMEWNGLKTIYFFSYPNGVYTKESIQCLKDNNYLAAVTGDAGYNIFKTDKYLLQRTNVSNYRFGYIGFQWRILKTKILYRLGINQH